MEGASRVFAGEFAQSTLVVPSGDAGSPGWIVTPGGAWCRQMYIAGALTETAETGDLLRCRVADPTGAFDVVAGGRNAVLAQNFRKIPVPSFVAIGGNAQMYQKNGTRFLSVRPEHVQVIDRAGRDHLLLITAEYTLRRLEALHGAVAGTCTDDRILRAAGHYAMTVPRILELAGMVEDAVLSVRPQEQASSKEQPDVRTLVVELMRDAAGPRGIAVEDILSAMELRGIRKDDVLSAIGSLVQDDECYQPQKGYVKLL